MRIQEKKYQARYLSFAHYDSWKEARRLFKRWKPSKILETSFHISNIRQHQSYTSKEKVKKDILRQLFFKNTWGKIFLCLSIISVLYYLISVSFYWLLQKNWFMYLNIFCISLIVYLYYTLSFGYKKIKGIDTSKYIILKKYPSKYYI